MQLEPAQVCQFFDLGDPLRPLQAVSGGLSHRVWKLDATRGTYVVKEMNRFWDDPNWLPWVEQAWSFEQRALATGVLMPQPVVNLQTGSCLAEIPSGNERPHTVRVHEWVEADSVESSKPAAAGVAGQVGAILSVLHGMNVTDFIPAIVPGLETHGSDAWNEIAGEVASRGIAWSSGLTEAMGCIAEAEALVGAASLSNPAYLLTHGDIDQKNLLRRNGEVLLVDWDACNAMPARHELVRCALDLAGWASGRPDLRICEALLDSYIRSGGIFDSIKPDDFASAFKAHLDWIWFNIGRAMGNRVQADENRQLAMQLVPADLGQLQHMLDIAAQF